MEISNINLSLKKKYLKYKAKYMALKNMNMIGGGYFSKEIPHRTYYIMANISKPELITALNNRRDDILLRNGESHTYHLTLLTIELNRSLKIYADRLENLVTKSDGQKIKILKPEIQKMVFDAYNETFKKSRVVLSQERGRYYKMGNFYAKKYPIKSDESKLKFRDNNVPTINAFRIKFYEKLRIHLGVNFTWDITDPNYALAINESKDIIFAVPKYDFGIGIWEPHVSIVKDTEISDYNKDLFRKLQSSFPELEITKYLSNKNFNELPEIDMSRDIDSVIMN